MIFMQKRRFYVMLCYGMLFFCLLFFSLPLNEFNAVISAHRQWLTGNFHCNGILKWSSQIKKTILVCRYSDVTLIDIELRGKGGTDCENSDNTSCTIIYGSELENFVYINRILTKLWR